MMNELIKELKHFISRDVFYILGGALILYSFSYKLGLIYDSNLPTVIYLFLAGISYVLGFVAQETFSLIGLVTTGQTEPGSKMKALYRIWVGVDWKVENLDLHRYKMLIYEKTNEQLLAQLNRIISLKHIGSTMASCFLISCVFFLSKATETELPKDIVMTISSFIIGILLIFLNRLQSAQQIKFMDDLLLRIRESEPSLVKEK